MHSIDRDAICSHAEQILAETLLSSGIAENYCLITCASGGQADAAAAAA